MIIRYSSNNKSVSWYGVAKDNGYETVTLFNSYSLAECQKFIRRAKDDTMFITQWIRDDNGLAWAIKDLEHTTEV